MTGWFERLIDYWMGPYAHDREAKTMAMLRIVVYLTFLVFLLMMVASVR